MGSTASSDIAPKDRVKASWLFAYSLPGLPIAAMGLPLAVHLPNFYAVEVGLGYAAAGFIFFLPRFLDIFLDPVMGVASDSIHTPWGRRRVWMVASVPIMIVASVLLFMPPAGITSVAAAGVVVLLFIGWTMLTVTHLAWGGELSGNYHERSRITAAREAAFIIGMFTVLLLPVIIQANGGDRFAQVAAFGWYVIVTLPIGVAVAVMVIKEDKSPPAPALHWRAALSSVAANKPLRYLLFADLIAGLSTGTVATLFLAMTTVGLALGTEANWLLLIYFGMGVLFIPPMLWVSKRLGKHQTLAISSLINAVLIPCIFLLPKGEFVPAAILWTLFGANMAVGPFLFRAIMADVADHDHVETGQPRAGVYFALLAATNKLGYSAAIFFAFGTLALIGFQQNVVNPPEVVNAMMLLYVVPPTIVSAAVAAVMWRFPLDETKQRELRRIIEERSAAGTVIGEKLGHTLEAEEDVPVAAAVVKPAE